MPKVDAAYLEARRREILDAAMACFAREGFHRTTMQDIVKETGRSAGAIYRYFRTKEDIVEAIAHERHAIEQTMLEQALDLTDVSVALRQLARGLLGRLADPAEQRWRRVTVQVWAEALRDDRVMKVVRNGLDGPVEMLADIVRKGQNDGKLPKDLDPEGAARVCAAIFHGLVLQQAWDPKVDVGAYVDAALRILEALLSATAKGVRPRGTSRASSVANR